MGFVEGRRARGRQRVKYMDGIKEVFGCSRIEEVVRLADDRAAWHSTAAIVNIDMALR